MKYHRCCQGYFFLNRILIRFESFIFHPFFSTESDAVLIFDADTLQCMDFNDAGVDLYRYNKEEFLKLNLLDFTAES